MRIVIDLQGAQTTGSRNRGIGRYSTALAQAIIRNRKEHEVHLVLNGAFPESIEELKQTFGNLLPADHFHVFEPLPHVARNVAGSRARRRASENLRELFIRRLQPDVVHITSLFEGLTDDCVCSVGKLYTDVPTSVTLYDLIPLIHRDKYLTDPSVESWYFERLDNLRRASSCFAISESAREEAIEYLALDPAGAVNVSTAVDPQFHKISLSDAEEAELREAYGLDRPFIMYTGGIDLRKNLEGLIRAYALLPKSLRKAHQLAVVCSAAPPYRDRLLALAEKVGLQAGDLVMTGFVCEEHLIGLYNLTKLFVFPSWHEGFGLPALEAMCCGAPVIASNRSSMPEVVGFEEALFDPFDDNDIAAHIRRGLEDQSFRKLLVKTAAKQVRRFSWDKSGRRAVDALERLHANSVAAIASERLTRPRLAMVAPMPPARTGIADYTAELLLALGRHYEIDIVVKAADVEKVEFPLCPEPIEIVPDSTFAENWQSYDRILYQFGNSEYHDYMFPLLALTSGVIVLHDFFLSGAISYREWHNQECGAWSKQLYLGHGYAATRMRGESEDQYDVVWKYPCSYSVMENAQQVVVHSEYSKDLARHWYGNAVAEKITVIPQLHEPYHDQIDRGRARQRLGVAADEFLVCCFGLLGPTKCNLELIEAWDRSGLARDAKARLVFVGENDAGDYGRDVTQKIAELSSDDSVAISGWVDADSFEDYLAAAEIAVQLRTRSRGETSRTVLDCMSRGIPLIVNANGSNAELSDEAAIILPDEFETAELVNTLQCLHEDQPMRARMGAAGRRIIKQDHEPNTCADAFRSVIEAASREDHIVRALTETVARVGLSDAEIDTICRETARMLADTPPRLLIDITALVHTNAHTGIQRVVRNLLWQILGRGAGTYRVEPVYVDPEARSFRFARAFTQSFAQTDIGGLADEVVDITSRDILLLLDLNPVLLEFVSEELARLSRQGTRKVFAVYDLLPIRFPEMFPEDSEALHRRWLQWVTQADAALCISEAVAAELRDYVAKNDPDSRVSISSFPLGSGLEADSGAEGVAGEAAPKIGLDFKKPTFLAVGTIEPRKGYSDVLDAFETLWAEGEDVNLCIVGRPGWKVDDLVERLVLLRERGAQLAWVNDASDAMLDALYREATCLIAASCGEGFGLPLIEGALRGVPLIARDITVFREVCGDGATYFSDDLAQTLREWLSDYRSGEVRGSDKVVLTSWEQSAEALLQAVLPIPSDKENEPDNENRNRNGHHRPGRRLPR